MDVLNQLVQYQNEYASIVQRYQILIGVLIVPLLYLVRNLPMAIFEVILNWLTIELIVDESDNVSGESYKIFSEWLTTHRIEALSRRFEVTVDATDYIYRIVSGIGIQYFRYDGSFFIGHTSREKVQGTMYQSKSVGTHKIRTFKWNRSKLISLVNIACNDNRHYVPSITLFSQDCAFMAGSIPTYTATQKQLISKGTYDLVDATFSRFVNDPQHYIDGGIPHKETIMLYGPPGTGKTNLARHMASKWEMDILSIDSKSVSVQSMLAVRSIAQRRNGTIILIEEIDSNPEFLVSNDSANITITDPNKIPCTRQDLLSALDGIVPLNKCVVIMTTNYKDKLYPNIYRKGRVDHLIHVDFMSPNEVVEFLGLSIDNEISKFILSDNVGTNISAAMIHQLRYIDTLEEAIDIITRKDHTSI